MLKHPCKNPLPLIESGIYFDLKLFKVFSSIANKVYEIPVRASGAEM
ncbi:hypothetical protein NTGM5_260008 [Candidatus Nitrotoga sp. M5]|nr:hypothetical protein NTGM5_260008 [Candidatus Nitrotoga sp. M5]